VTRLITALYLSSLCGCYIFVPGAAPPPGADAPTGNLATARSRATATLLPNGKVLIAGGVDTGGGALASAELFDPSGNDGTGAFSATGSLAAARFDATATLLSNGKVLIAGGKSGQSQSVIASAELFDPTANAGVGAFTVTGSLAVARSGATATLLRSGKVLIASGAGANGYPGAEVYDPAADSGAGAFTAIGDLITPRSATTATLLPDGRVLIAGGLGGNGGSEPILPTELYDPMASAGAGAFKPSASLTHARGAATATLLLTGKVLIAGGSYGAPLGSAEIYDPGEDGGPGAVVAAADLVTARSWATANLLPNGSVLLIGSETATASTDLFDPAGNNGAGSFATSGPLATARSFATATLLPSGNVLVAGGFDDVNALASAELHQ
jgi:hypothetical protein